MASRSLPPVRRRCVQVFLVRELAQDVAHPKTAGFLRLFYSQQVLRLVSSSAPPRNNHHNHRRRPLSLHQHQHHSHASSSTALNDLSSSPLRRRDVVGTNERDRALRLYEKIMSNIGSGEGLDQPLITAAEGCLDILARLEPQQQKTTCRKGEGTRDHTSADMALNLMNHLQTQQRNAGIITGQMYEFAIQTLAKQPGRAEDAYNLLNEYISIWESKGSGSSKPSNDTNMRAPNSILISSAINACAKDPNPMGGQMADELLRRMIQLHDKYPTRGASPFLPNAISFTAVIDGWSRRGDAEKAEAVLGMMTEFDVKPSIVSYNAVIAAWSRVAKNKRIAAKHAEKMFQHVLDMPGIEPDVHSYASLLLALTNSCKQPEGVERAADILRGMEKEVDFCFLTEARADATKTQAVIPNVVCYNTVIHGYSKLKRPIEAEDLFCRMVERHEQNPLAAPAPNGRTLNAAMSAWAKSGHRDSGRKAQDLLEVIESMNDDGKHTGAQAASEATVRPDIFGYNIVLDGWRRGSSIESALGADNLLQSMERGERFVMPDRTSYNTVIDAFCKAGRDQQRNHYRKGRHRKENRGNSHSHMDGTLDNLCAAQRAEDLLHRMDTAGVHPCTWSYNTVLNAWARSGQGKKAADHASALLLTMEERQEQDERRGKKEKLVCPDARSYSAVIDAIARSGDTDAPDRAAAILSQMEANGLSPNTFTLNGILNCWAKSSRHNSVAAAEADNILRKMEKNKGEHSNYSGPDLISYCLVVTAFAWNRSDVNKAVKAREVLNKMLNFLYREEGFRRGGESKKDPDHTQKSKLQSAYNSVLSACAHMPRHSGADDLERATVIALQTYDELHRSNLVPPNEETYYIFLTVCRNLFKNSFIRRGDGTSGAEEKMIERVMQDCSDRGLVTDRIIELQQSLSSKAAASPRS